MKKMTDKHATVIKHDAPIQEQKTRRPTLAVRTASREYFVEVHADGDLEVTPVPVASARGYERTAFDCLRMATIDALTRHLNDVMGPSTPFTADELAQELRDVEDYNPKHIRNR